MNYECRDDRKGCPLHPREGLVGVCAFCLNEKLLVLASKQVHLNTTKGNYSVPPRRVLPKVFSLASLLIKQQKSGVYHSSSTSQEDSFISIKFEDNGVASWDKGKITKIPQCEMLDKNRRDKPGKIKCVIEHMKPCTAQRWRRRISHLLQLIRWKKSSKCQVGTKLEGGKVKKYGWMRTLTKRRAKA